MKKNAMLQNLLCSIKRSIARYIAIMAIIALGAGLYVGLLATKTDMVATGQQFVDRQQMFDLRLLNTYGWTQTELDTISTFEEVDLAEGLITLDALGYMGSGGEEKVYQLHSIPQYINQPYLLGGRMPTAPNECLADGDFATDDILGTTFRISDNNESGLLDSVEYTTYTVVGYVNSPLFMDMTRGNTSLGNGTISTFVYIPKDAFTIEYFTEIAVRIPGDWEVYSDSYNDALELYAEAIELKLEPLAAQRFEQVRKEAEDSLQEGLAEYNKGYQEYLDGKAEAERELAEGRFALIEAQTEIEKNEALLLDGQKQIEDGQKQIDDNYALLSGSMQTLAEAKAEAYAQLASANNELLTNYKTVTDNIRTIDSALTQIDQGLAQLDSGISQLESGLEQLNLTVGILDTLIDVSESTIQISQSALDRAKENGTLDEETIKEMETRLEEAKTQRDEYVKQREELLSSRAEYEQQLIDLKAQRDEVYAQRAELVATKDTLNAALDQISDGFLELQNSQLQADNEFAAAEAKIEAGKLALDASQKALDTQKAEIEKGLKELEAGKQELAEGWKTYYEGANETNITLAEAQLELVEALVALSEGEETLRTMTAAEVYVLDRNTNAGYLAVDSNSDIVAGVSRVFPVFFLLIAALVCITTMTRMVDEERTQIGTLKALGYSNFAIVSKYLLYAGSAAVFGCGFGVLVGSIVFPTILWTAYSLILSISPNIVITFDVTLCLTVVGVYTVVILGVTWYCCHRSLREVPAELVRPKAPTSGKKILVEYLPFWDKINFLNKVMLRNIFRYRQRLLMMLIGIGGCTALLMTGFGIGDSIMNIVSYQFDEVTVYDIQAYFAEPLDEKAQADILNDLSADVESVVFAQQSGIDLDFENGTKNVYLVSAGNDLKDHFDFHQGNEQLSMPATGEVLLSSGVSENLGIQVGDSIRLRNSDMEMLNLKVSGVFDNHVYNYAIVSPETLTEQWGRGPECQTAFVKVRSGVDPHTVGAKLSDAENIMTVMISQDLADQVGSMLQAMNTIVITVVICAGLLAVIVLYNLTNINITERLREIATIKVLGFRSVESAMYVFKENLCLTVVGSLLGLWGGKLLLDFVMSQIKIDMVWFLPRIEPLSVLLSLAITLLMALLVDFILYFRLQRINMAEALKSVE